jgi:adenine-specific DNA-methyltransferase
MVNHALNEAEKIRPKPAYIVFAAFQFDPAAANVIEDTTWPGVMLLKVQMNPDLMTADLKKKSSTSQSFWLVGQPDVGLIKIGKREDKGKYKVKVKGFDYYDVKAQRVISGGTDKIAMWMLDTDYDGMSVNRFSRFSARAAAAALNSSVYTRRSFILFPIFFSSCIVFPAYLCIYQLG